MTTITIPLDVAEAAAEALCNFVSDHGWADSDMQAMDNLDAYIQRHKASRTELAEPEQEETFIPNWANYRQGVADGNAGSPKWHDAPTCDGLWVCNEGDDNPYRWTTHSVKFPISPLLVGEDEKWFGPIPQDIAKEERTK